MPRCDSRWSPAAIGVKATCTSAFGETEQTFNRDACRRKRDPDHYGPRSKVLSEKPIHPAYAEVWRRSADPPGSIILRYGKTTPIYGLLGSLAVRMAQATLVAAIAAAVQFAPLTLLSAEEGGRPALMIEIEGAIGPATARYVKEALTTAGERRGRRRFSALGNPGGGRSTQRGSDRRV